MALDKALKCVENLIKVSARVLGGRSVLQWLALVFLPKFLGKADLGGRLAHLFPMDSVCLHTASMVWNVPGKYGPHGELLSLLIEEPATMLDSETFSPLHQC